MNSEKRTRYIIAAASLLLMFVFFTLFVRMKTTVFLIFGLIMLNIAFQFITRLIISTICEGVFENGVNSSSDFFRTSAFEERLYNTLGVKRLKKQLPKTDRTNFSLRRQSIQDIVDAGCEIEAEHELCMVASVLAILFAVPFGYVWLFVIVAVLAVVFDLVIVMIQRFNRPRLITVQLKRRARFFEKLENQKENSDGEEQPNENQQDDPTEQAEQLNENKEQSLTGDCEEDKND